MRHVCEGIVLVTFYITWFAKTSKADMKYKISSHIIQLNGIQRSESTRSTGGPTCPHEHQKELLHFSSNTRGQKRLIAASSPKPTQLKTEGEGAKSRNQRWIHCIFGVSEHDVTDHGRRSLYLEAVGVCLTRPEGD